MLLTDYDDVFGRKTDRPRAFISPHLWKTRYRIDCLRVNRALITLYARGYPHMKIRWRKRLLLPQLLVFLWFGGSGPQARV